MTLQEIARQAAAKSRGISLGVFDDVADAVTVVVLRESLQIAMKNGAVMTAAELKREIALLALPVRPVDPTALTPEQRSAMNETTVIPSKDS